MPAFLISTGCRMPAGIRRGNATLGAGHASALGPGARPGHLATCGSNRRTDGHPGTRPTGVIMTTA